MMARKTLKIFLLISTGLALSLVGIFAGCSAFGTRPEGADIGRLEASPQFDAEKKVFFNRDREAFRRMEARPKLKGRLFKFLFGSDPGDRPIGGLPVVSPNLDDFLSPSQKLKVLWFGHSTFLLNLDGKLILVDPVLSDYASPIPFIIKRFQPPPIKLEDLPNIDFIVISHDHYDHLDMPTIKAFLNKQTSFLVPLGVGSHLRGWGINPAQIREHDWWQSSTLAGIEFTATPAQHFSGRSLTDRNSTLWAGWVIRSSEHKIFFSGDTGYHTHFKEIGDRFGPFDIAFIENGQYNESWKEVHLLPDQGVAAFFELRAKIFFPVHWGAFRLSIHPWFEPVERVYESSRQRSFRLLAPRIGEVVTVGEHEQVSWWEAFIGSGAR